MKILSTKQIREADQYTIENEPISSLDLMERAAERIFEAISLRFHKSIPFRIYCGMGNNGGDGLALARLMYEAGYEVDIVVLEHSDRSSKDFKSNFERLPKGISATRVKALTELLAPDPDIVLVDAILGSGLQRPLESLLRDAVKSLNELPNYRIAVDIPTGLFADNNSMNDLTAVLKCHWTLSLQLPKRSFYHRNTREFPGEISIIDIGISEAFINKATTKAYLLDEQDCAQIFKPRKRHSYKADYGHAFLFAGSKGSMGAAIMAGTACMRAGAGLLSICAPTIGLNPLQVALPEAMVIPDPDPEKLGHMPNLNRATAIGIGPGIGVDQSTSRLIKSLIQDAGRPMVMDADALNILSDNPTWIPFLPPNTILTPHIGEFRRLIQSDKLDETYLEELREFCVKNKVITILKDSISCVCDAEGNQFFVDAGSAALASAGSGDVLTGIVLGLLSSGYSPLQAALLGVYLHAEAGRISGEYRGLESTLARDVIDNLGEAFHLFY